MAKPERDALRFATENLGKRADLELMLTVIRDDDEERAIEAYATWRERYPLNGVDIHAMKLVPRMTTRLRALGIEDEESGRLAGIGKYLLAQGHAIMDGARVAADWLTKASIETVAVKGVMIRALGYASAYERPMVDADLVLMRPSEYLEAAAVLRRWGWAAEPALEHATTFKKGKSEIDLHRMVLRQDPSFALANSVSWIAGDPYNLVNETPALIITCLHGLRTDGGALWVFDAEALVKSGTVDWEFVVAYAARKRLVLALSAALSRVRGVPHAVKQQLNMMPASHVEALELRHVTTRFDRLGDRASRLLPRLRDRSEVVDLRVHEEEPGMRWDARWEKEWQ